MANKTNRTGNLSTSVFTAEIADPTLEQQFKEMKRKHPDAIILFRIGYFYECLEADAERLSEILNINLVKSGNGITMAGFPHTALETYLPKMIRSGCRVAICEQTKTDAQ